MVVILLAARGPRRPAGASVPPKVRRLPRMEHVDVLVVGGGSAGLSVSHELDEPGIDHVVLERGRVGQTWRDPLGQLLPGHPQLDDAAAGWRVRGRRSGRLHAPRRDRRPPRAIRRILRGAGPGGRRRPDDRPRAGRLRRRTTAGDLRATQVVLCTGAFQRAHRPAGADALPADLLQMDIGDYTNAAALPSGPILIIGSGQSGCQLAEELREAGRDVVLSCGKAPWLPRRIGGRDLIWWLEVSGFMDLPVATLPSPMAAAWREPPGDRPRRRPRPAPPDASGARGDARGPLPRGRGPGGTVRAGPRRVRVAWGTHGIDELRGAGAPDSR